MEEIKYDVHTLEFGINLSEAIQLAASHGHKLRYPNPTYAFSNIDWIGVGYSSIRKFPNDCGMLTVAGGNYLNIQELKFIEEYASCSGFDKIILTIAVFPEFLDEYKRRYTGWEIIHSAPSNRNPNKISIVFFKHVNCVKKGYL